MPKVEDGRELKDAEVLRISIVDRGANGDPFRVLKRKDTPMIDLSRVVKAGSPRVAFVGVSKAADQAPYIAAIKAAGLVDGAPEDGGTAFIYKQEAELPDDPVLLKLSDTVVLGLADPGGVVKKAFEVLNFESVSFKELLSQEGALPMIHTAKAALEGVIANALYKSDSKAQMTSIVNKAVKDFGDYVAKVLDQIPETAFKLDTLIQEMAAKAAEASKDVVTLADEKVVPADEAEKPAGGQAEGDTPAGVVAKADEPAKSENDEDADKAAAAVAKAEGKSETSKAEEDPVAAALASLTANLGDQIAKALAPLADQVGSVAKQVDDVSKRQGEVEKTLKGTTIGNKEGDEPAPRFSTQKSDDGGRFHFDTGAGIPV